MSNCFRMDLKRSIFCKKFCAVVLGVLIVLIISTWDDLKMYTRWGDVPGYSGPVDTLAKSLAFDKFKIVVVFLLGGLYTGSYCSDMQSRYIRSIFTRTTITSYTLTRFAVNCLAIILGMLVSFGLYSILCLFGGMPLVGSYVEGFFYGAFAVRHPVFYLIMMALQFGVITVACSGIGLLLSVYQANLFVAVGTCGLVFYVAVSYIPSRSIFSILGLISMSSTWGSTVSHRLMFLWGMLYPLTIYAFCAFFFARRLEWRKKHGLI